jgi:outer membrane beta-barrel protein
MIKATRLCVVKFQTSFYALFLAVSVFSTNALANPSNDRVELVKSEVKRQNVKFDRIDSEMFEITVAPGVMAIEDFDTSGVIGMRFAFHLNEFIFFEGSYSISEGDKTSYEELRPDVTLISDDDRKYKTWDGSLGINWFPGETWLFGKAYSSDVYTVAGFGKTDFGGRSWSTINIGLGYRLYLNDWLTLRLDVRDHIFNRNIYGEDDRTNNFETTLGFGFFF